jgi:hypothetical protein
MNGYGQLFGSRIWEILAGEFGGTPGLIGRNSGC